MDRFQPVVYHGDIDRLHETDHVKATRVGCQNGKDNQGSLIDSNDSTPIQNRSINKYIDVCIIYTCNSQTHKNDIHNDIEPKFYIAKLGYESEISPETAWWFQIQLVYR